MNQPTTTLDNNSGCGLVLHILLTILLPPLGVFLKVGVGGHFWLNILLTILGILPGQIHGIWVLLKK